jgi:hypothetical protein
VDKQEKDEELKDKKEQDEEKEMLDREEKEELEANKNKKSECGEDVSKPRVSKVKRMLDLYKSPIQK